MKVLFIHPFLYRYVRGIERYTVCLANELAAKGLEVSILTWREKNPVRLVEPIPDVRIYQLPQSRYYASKAIIPFYLLHLLTHSYDAIFIHFAGYGEAETLALMRYLKKVCYNIVFHYPFVQVPHRYREFQRFNTAQNAAHMVAVSRFVAGGIQSAFQRESTLIGYGVDTRQFVHSSNVRKVMRQSLGISPETPVLVTSAALEERKGVQWVLRALPEIKQEYPDVRYFVLGEGACRGTLESLVRDLDLETNVIMPGVRTDIQSYYQFADVALLLSYGEASPLTPLEYMACELPVIVSQHPPYDEIIRPEYGLMVNEERSSEVAGAIKCLLQDQDLRLSMGRAGRQKILTEHTWGNIADQYLALINSPWIGN